MPSFRIPTPIRPQILPEHRIPLDGLKRNPLMLRIIFALNKLTPLLIRRHFQPRKIGPATGAVCFQVDHESRDSVSTPRCPRPVVVVDVVA